MLHVASNMAGSSNGQEVKASEPLTEFSRMTKILKMAAGVYIDKKRVAKSSAPAELAKTVLVTAVNHGYTNMLLTTQRP